MEQFAEKAKLETCSEVERAVLLGYFHLKKNDLSEFSINQVASWFQSLHFASPNTTRLRKKIGESPDLVRGSDPNCFRVGRARLVQLATEFPELDNSEFIFQTGSILPESLYAGTRGFLVCLADQINSSYENRLFDGCAVLMRRVVEILLILSFEHHNIAGEIKSADDTYLMLDPIITRAKNHPTLKLSRNSRESLEVFRVLGNFSAHKIYYNCKQNDIRKVALDFRALFEELLYKSGIKV